MLSLIADILGIIGFLITVVLLIYSEELRKAIKYQRSDYRKEQKDMRIILTALRDNVLKDDILNLKMISDIRTVIFTSEQKYGYLSNVKDRIHNIKIKSILSKPIESINKNSLCKELDYNIARFERRENK